MPITKEVMDFPSIVSVKGARVRPYLMPLLLLVSGSYAVYPLFLVPTGAFSGIRTVWTGGIHSGPSSTFFTVTVTVAVLMGDLAVASLVYGASLATPIWRVTCSRSS